MPDEDATTTPTPPTPNQGATANSATPGAAPSGTPGAAPSSTPSAAVSVTPSAPIPTPEDDTKAIDKDEQEDKKAPAAADPSPKKEEDKKKSEKNPMQELVDDLGAMVADINNGITDAIKSGVSKLFSSSPNAGVTMAQQEPEKKEQEAPAPQTVEKGAKGNGPDDPKSDAPKPDEPKPDANMDASAADPVIPMTPGPSTPTSTTASLEAADTSKYDSSAQANTTKLDPGPSPSDTPNPVGPGLT